MTRALSNTTVGIVERLELEQDLLVTLADLRALTDEFGIRSEP